MGIFILLIIILSFGAGAIRGELVLTLIGAVFSAVWAYCLVMTLLLALLHYRAASRLTVRLSPGEVAAGEWAQVVYNHVRIFQLPGILVRFRLLLSTRDSRRIVCDFAPSGKAAGGTRELFEVKKRGAYFSLYDEFAVFDILGFFRFAFRIPCENSARLLASPHAAAEPVPANARSGESARQPEMTYVRTDNLIDHRPYVPGDDPRRINWKLYSHGGELFVREGEREPPPHSNIIILIDTQFDPQLYTAASARRGIDLLCENALAAALACAADGLNVQIGSADMPTAIMKPGTPAETATALAWPAAMTLSAQAQLPNMPEDRGVILMALPRASAESSALDHFLLNSASRSAGLSKVQSTELIFLYGSNTDTELAAAAQTCAAIYNKRPGVRARAICV